ncbi:hypothetical protein NCC49_003288 [Naganishia albida]|nr:hypothetical protein NCC49_003288 [Naganishia albida]
MELLETEDRLVARGGLFERDGMILTASALSLLQAQEAMDRADSAGQGEYGPDVWDPIRGQYIPKWAKKLDPADRWPLLAEDGRMPLFYEDGQKMEDWYDVDLDVVEARNLQKYGIDGVVDYPY